jgi:hypothetical protein
MRTLLFRSVLVGLTFSCCLFFGQTQTINVISSTYTLTMPAGFTDTVYSRLQLSISYPANLPASSYILYSRLNSDFQGFVTGSGSSPDAPEAYLSIGLQGILTKYPQITGGTLSAAISGPGTVVPGTMVTIPGAASGSVTVAIGVYGTVAGLSTVQATPVSSVSSVRNLALPAGFTGPALSTVSLGLVYPTGLSPDSYVASKQLLSDFQGFSTAYPTPSDPPEAFLSTTLQQMLSKYSQISGGTLSGSISGPGMTIPGTTVTTPGPVLGTISAAIGNFDNAYGLFFGFAGNVSNINSRWLVTLPAGFPGPTFSTVYLSVNYPTGLGASSYITNKQLTSDFQGFISAYPTPSDAPEAYLSSALQQILSKYSQMPGGNVAASIKGPDMVIPGTNVTTPGPPIGTVAVYLGVYNFGTVLTPFAKSAPIEP